MIFLFRRIMLRGLQNFYFLTRDNFKLSFPTLFLFLFSSFLSFFSSLLFSLLFFCCLKGCVDSIITGAEEKGLSGFRALDSIYPKVPFQKIIFILPLLLLNFLFSSVPYHHFSCFLSFTFLCLSNCISGG